VTYPGGDKHTSDDGVMVVSIWNQATPDRFFARVILTVPDHAPTVEVVNDPEVLVERVRTWVASTRPMRQGSP